MMKRVFARAIGVGGIVLGATLVSASCGGGTITVDDSGAGGGTGSCEGGVVIDGKCEAKCVSAKCIQPPEGQTWENTCVENACKLVCDSHAQCLVDGTQDCEARVRDDSGEAANACVSNGKTQGYGAKCPNDTECDAIFACPNGEPCGASNCGGDVTACVLDAAACTKRNDDGSFTIDSTCTLGRCKAEGAAYDGAPCHLGADPCPANECKALTCLTTGLGDAEAYCTKADCSADADCPGGYACEITRDPHGICNSSPPKGNSNLCGKTSEACIDPASFMTDGATYFEGSLCLLHKQCIKRQPCATCETDLDCSLTDHQRCIQIGATKNCALDCSASKDCPADFKCDAGSCIPRSGACRSPGTFCSVCLNDEDCGSVGSSFACIDATGGQKACFDMSFPDLCTTNADCPTSPSGKHGECLDEGEGLAPGDSVYHHCYIPFNANNNKFGCW